MKSLLIKQRPPIDSRWFEQLIKIVQYTPEIYAWLGPSQLKLEQAYEVFTASDFKATPNLRPNDQECVAIIAEKQALAKLLSDVMRYEQNILVRDAYRLRLQELIDSASLYEAALLGDTAEFSRINEVLYGRPDEAIFNAVCAWYRQQAVAWATEDHQCAEAAQVVLDLMPSAAPQAIAPSVRLRPDDRTFASQHRLHMYADGFYRRLFEGLELPKADVDEEAGDHLIMTLLKNLEAKDYAIHDAPDNSWSLRFSNKRVVRPAGYSLPAAEFVAVVGHEIGSHLLERLNGLRQPLRLLSFGLQGYEKGNEGRALLREQAVYSSWQLFERQPRWHEILRRHLAISLAVGADGKSRTSAEVYKIIYAADMLWARHNVSADIDNEELKKHIQAQSWQLVTRVLKGTDGTAGAYCKDIVYLEGNISCWRQAARYPGSIGDGDSGKVDISNDGHQAVLKALRA